MQFPTHLPDTIRVKVSPGAKKNEYITTLPDDTIKIRLRATPTDGKANIALVAFLKEETSIDWEIISGFTSPFKLLKRK